MDPIEKLTIETPEQIALEFPLAGVGSRGMALLVDTLVQGVTALVVIVAAMLLGPDLSIYWTSAGKWMTAAVIILLFCLYWGYFAIFEALWNGQTPGKRQAKIRVISASGRPITVFESIARKIWKGEGDEVKLLAALNKRVDEMMKGLVPAAPR